MARTSGKEELEAPERGLHSLLAELQEKLAFLPDYSFKETEKEDQTKTGEAESQDKAAKEEPWPAVNAGTSVSGLIGGVITMGMAGLIGFGLRRYRRKS